jgi:hypothetical protein
MTGPLIEVVVTPQGVTHVQTKGFAGTALSRSQPVS